MDPNATLATIRELIHHNSQLPHNSLQRDDSRTLDELIEYFDGLDQWLSKGGFLPAPWSKAPRKEG